MFAITQLAILAIIIAITSTTTQAAELKLIRKIPPSGDANAILDVTFSPDGKWIACLADDSSIQLFDAQSYKPVRKWGGFKDGCQYMQFSHDGKKFMAAPRDLAKPLHVWNVADGKLLHQINVKTSDSLIASAMPNIDQVAILYTDPRIAVGVWSLATGKVVRQAELSGSFPGNMKVAPKGNRLVVSHEEFSLLVDTTTLKIVKDLEDSPSTFDISPDGKSLAQAFGNEIYFQPLESDETRKIALPASRKSILEMDYTPDGKVIVLSRTDFRDVKLVTEILLVDIAGKGVIGKLEHQSDNKVSTYAISPDGARLATTVDEGKGVAIWDISPWSKPAPRNDGSEAFRTWKSADGKFQVEATFVKSDGSHATLKRKDNNITVTVAISNLSNSDQTYLNEIRLQPKEQD